MDLASIDLDGLINTVVDDVTLMDDVTALGICEDTVNEDSERLWTSEELLFTCDALVKSSLPYYVTKESKCKSTGERNEASADTNLILDDASADVNFIPDEASADVNLTPDEASADVNHIPNEASADMNLILEDDNPECRLSSDKVLCKSSLTSSSTSFNSCESALEKCVVEMREGSPVMYHSCSSLNYVSEGGTAIGLNDRATDIKANFPSELGDLPNEIDIGSDSQLVNGRGRRVRDDSITSDSVRRSHALVPDQPPIRISDSVGDEMGVNETVNKDGLQCLFFPETENRGIDEGVERYIFPSLIVPSSAAAVGAKDAKAFDVSRDLFCLPLENEFENNCSSVFSSSTQLKRGKYENKGHANEIATVSIDNVGKNSLFCEFCDFYERERESDKDDTMQNLLKWKTTIPEGDMSKIGPNLPPSGTFSSVDDDDEAVRLNYLSNFTTCKPKYSDKFDFNYYAGLSDSSNSTVPSELCDISEGRLTSDPIISRSCQVPCKRLSNVFHAIPVFITDDESVSDSRVPDSGMEDRTSDSRVPDSGMEDRTLFISKIRENKSNENIYKFRNFANGASNMEASNDCQSFLSIGTVSDFAVSNDFGAAEVVAVDSQQREWLRKKSVGEVRFFVRGTLRKFPVFLYDNAGTIESLHYYPAWELRLAWQGYDWKLSVDSNGWPVIVYWEGMADCVLNHNEPPRKQFISKLYGFAIISDENIKVKNLVPIFNEKHGSEWKKDGRRSSICTSVTLRSKTSTKNMGHRNSAACDMAMYRNDQHFVPIDENEAVINGNDNNDALELCSVVLDCSALEKIDSSSDALEQEGRKENSDENIGDTLKPTSVLRSKSDSRIRFENKENSAASRSISLHDYEAEKSSNLSNFKGVTLENLPSSEMQAAAFLSSFLEQSMYPEKICSSDKGSKKSVHEAYCSPESNTHIDTGEGPSSLIIEPGNSLPSYASNLRIPAVNTRSNESNAKFSPAYPTISEDISSGIYKPSSTSHFTDCQVTFVGTTTAAYISSYPCPLAFSTIEPAVSISTSYDFARPNNLSNIAPHVKTESVVPPASTYAASYIPSSLSSTVLVATSNISHVPVSTSLTYTSPSVKITEAATHLSTLTSLAAGCYVTNANPLTTKMSILPVTQSSIPGKEASVLLREDSSIKMDDSPLLFSSDTVTQQGSVLNSSDDLSNNQMENKDSSSIKEDRRLTFKKRSFDVAKQPEGLPPRYSYSTKFPMDVICQGRLQEVKKKTTPPGEVSNPSLNDHRFRRQRISSVGQVKPLSSYLKENYPTLRSKSAGRMDFGRTRPPVIRSSSENQEDKQGSKAFDLSNILTEVEEDILCTPVFNKEDAINSPVSAIDKVCTPISNTENRGYTPVSSKEYKADTLFGSQDVDGTYIISKEYTPGVLVSNKEGITDTLFSCKGDTIRSVATNKEARAVTSISKKEDMEVATPISRQEDICSDASGKEDIVDKTSVVNIEDIDDTSISIQDNVITPLSLNSRSCDNTLSIEGNQFSKVTVQEVLQDEEGMMIKKTATHCNAVTTQQHICIENILESIPQHFCVESRPVSTPQHFCIESRPLSTPQNFCIESRPVSTPQHFCIESIPMTVPRHLCIEGKASSNINADFVKAFVATIVDMKVLYPLIKDKCRRSPAHLSRESKTHSGKEPINALSVSSIKNEPRSSVPRRKINQRTEDDREELKLEVDEFLNKNNVEINSCRMSPILNRCHMPPDKKLAAIFGSLHSSDKDNIQKVSDKSSGGKSPELKHEHISRLTSSEFKRPSTLPDAEWENNDLPDKLMRVNPETKRIIPSSDRISISPDTNRSITSVDAGVTTCALLDTYLNNTFLETNKRTSESPYSRTRRSPDNNSTNLSSELCTGTNISSDTNVRTSRSPDESYFRTSRSPDIDCISTSRSPNEHYTRINKSPDKANQRTSRSPDVICIGNSKSLNENYTRTSRLPDIVNQRISRYPDLICNRVSRSPDLICSRTSKSPDLNDLGTNQSPDSTYIRTSQSANKISSESIQLAKPTDSELVEIKISPERTGVTIATKGRIISKSPENYCHKLPERTSSGKSPERFFLEKSPERTSLETISPERVSLTKLPEISCLKVSTRAFVRKSPENETSSSPEPPAVILAANNEAFEGNINHTTDKTILVSNCDLDAVRSVDDDLDVDKSVGDLDSARLVSDLDAEKLVDDLDTVKSVMEFSQYKIVDLEQDEAPSVSPFSNRNVTLKAELELKLDSNLKSELELKLNSNLRSELNIDADTFSTLDKRNKRNVDLKEIDREMSSDKVERNVTLTRPVWEVSLPETTKPLSFVVEEILDFIDEHSTSLSKNSTTDEHMSPSTVPPLSASLSFPISRQTFFPRSTDSSSGRTSSTEKQKSEKTDRMSSMRPLRREEQNSEFLNPRIDSCGVQVGDIDASTASTSVVAVTSYSSKSEDDSQSSYDRPQTDGGALASASSSSTGSALSWGSGNRGPVARRDLFPLEDEDVTPQWHALLEVNAPDSDEDRTGYESDDDFENMDAEMRRLEEKLKKFERELGVLSSGEDVDAPKGTTKDDTVKSSVQNNVTVPRLRQEDIDVLKSFSLPDVYPPVNILKTKHLSLMKKEEDVFEEDEDEREAQRRCSGSVNSSSLLFMKPLRKLKPGERRCRSLNLEKLWSKRGSKFSVSKYSNFTSVLIDATQKTNDVAEESQKVGAVKDLEEAEAEAAEDLRKEIIKSSLMARYMKDTGCDSDTARYCYGEFPPEEPRYQNSEHPSAEARFADENFPSEDVRYGDEFSPEEGTYRDDKFPSEEEDCGSYDVKSGGGTTDFRCCSFDCLVGEDMCDGFIWRERDSDMTIFDFEGLDELQEVYQAAEHGLFFIFEDDSEDQDEVMVDIPSRVEKETFLLPLSSESSYSPHPSNHSNEPGDGYLRPSSPYDKDLGSSCKKKRDISLVSAFKNSFRKAAKYLGPNPFNKGKEEDEIEDYLTKHLFSSSLYEGGDEEVSGRYNVPNARVQNDPTDVEESPSSGEYYAYPAMCVMTSDEESSGKVTSELYSCKAPPPTTQKEIIDPKEILLPPCDRSSTRTRGSVCDRKGTKDEPTTLKDESTSLKGDSISVKVPPPVPPRRSLLITDFAERKANVFETPRTQSPVEGLSFDSPLPDPSSVDAFGNVSHKPTSLRQIKRKQQERIEIQKTEDALDASGCNFCVGVPAVYRGRTDQQAGNHNRHPSPHPRVLPERRTWPPRK